MSIGDPVIVDAPKAACLATNPANHRRMWPKERRMRTRAVHPNLASAGQCNRTRGMHELVPPPASAVANTHCTAADYDRLYRQSLDDPDSFWRSQLGRLDWDSEPTIMGNWSYDPVTIKWFEDGVLNLCYNCVDRHLPARADAIAF